jgi:hypothetical protein
MANRTPLQSWGSKESTIDTMHILVVLSCQTEQTVSKMSSVISVEKPLMVKRQSGRGMEGDYSERDCGGGPDLAFQE